MTKTDHNGIFPLHVILMHITPVVSEQTQI